MQSVRYGRLVGRLQFFHEPVLGTVLEVQAIGRRRSLRKLEALLLSEIVRLERIFSVFLETSELARWRRGEVATGAEAGAATGSPRIGPVQSLDDPRRTGRVPLSRELYLLLELALHWQQRSGGVFNPSVGLLVELWRQAQAAGVEPSPEVLHRAVEQIREPCYVLSASDVAVGPAGVVKTGPCQWLNFNALAKGLVVDLACQHAMASDGLETLLVNIGGDLRHTGKGAIPVGIEDPHRAYDNIAPLTSIRVSNCGVATSGGARRGFDVGGRRYSHVIDPRTGRPVEHVASASVVAPDAATADVVATVLGVLTPAEGMAFAESLDAVECYVIDRDGACFASSHWGDR